MKKAIVVQTSGEYEIVEFDDSNSLAVLQKAVDGLIQPVSVRAPNLEMYANEEGLFRSDFTENFMASAIYEDAVGGTQCILGPVVFTGGVDENGNTNGLDEKRIDVIIRMADIQRTSLEELLNK